MALRSIILLLVLFVFNTSFARWELLQNSPTTNDLHSVFFINDNTGWIAGYNNTIYKTTNSGESWVQQTSPIASNFECITFVDANTGWACGNGGTVIKTTNGGANWFSQTFTSVKFNSLNFIDSNTGYICGDNGIIWKTINGGSNWTNQPTGIAPNLHQIKFKDATTGFAVGNNAYILKTSNGGLSWIIKSGPSIGGQIFYTVEFLANNVISAGTLSKYSLDFGENWYLGIFPIDAIYMSTFFQTGLYNGVGANGFIVNLTYSGQWNQRESPTNQNLYSINYKDSSSYSWAVGANGTILKYIPDWKNVLYNNIGFNDVDFINSNTGWCVGNIGNIQKTTNGGINWIYQSIYPINLNSVCFKNANTGYIVGNNGSIIKTTNGGINFIENNSGTSDLNSVYFTDINTGYTVGYGGTILKTINEGSNWTILNSGITYELNSVYFIDINTGYTVGYSGIILKTTNGGSEWNIQASNVNFQLNSVYFIDINTGYTVGYGGTILKTTNGGTSWIIYPNSPSYDNLRSVFFINANIGYVCSGASIYKTDNDGSTWHTEDFVPLYENNFKAMDFVVENNNAVGFAVGLKIFRTTFEYFGGAPVGNSGNYPGWVVVNSGTTGFITSVDYINPFVAFGVGGDPAGTELGLILRTINGGQSWTRQQSNELTTYFNDVSFADVNNGIAVGGFISGIIRKTTNGGANWVQQTSTPSYSLYSVDMLDINNAYACGFQGLMLHTSNGGTNWQSQPTGITGVSWNGINYINPTTATAVGTVTGTSGKIIRTTNTGLNWVSQTGGGNHDLRGVKFIDINNGIVISWEGPVLRTTNGGTNWIQTDSLSGHASDISYIDVNNIFIVTQDGVVSRIYRSTNGGLNFMLQDTREEILSSVFFTDANNGIITGTEGNILRTSNAGVISGTNNSYGRNSLNLPINDFQNTTDSININLTNNPNANAVTHVYLKIDTVLHTNDADLECYLEHNGITDTIIYRNGGSGDNFLGTFLNDATNFPLVSGTPPFKGSFKPYKPLSKFNGQNPNGAWKLRIYDRTSGNTGILNAWSLTLTYQIITGITENTEIPSNYQLSQNYPNPFNPFTKIKFSIPGNAGRDISVKFRIYDILGKQIATLINQQMRPGSYIIEWHAGNFSSGVYFYRLETDNFIQTKKMVLIK